MHYSVNILYKATLHEPELILCILTFIAATQADGLVSLWGLSLLKISKKERSGNDSAALSC